MRRGISARLGRIGSNPGFSKDRSKRVEFHFYARTLTVLAFLVLAASGFAQNSSSASPLQFVAVTPCRVADTRNPAGPFGGPEPGKGAIREFDIPQSACGIPSTAVAYSLNVTVVPDGFLNYLTLWPTGQTQPNVSTLNSDGRVKANAAITPAGTNGGVSVFVSDPTQVILDIDGYFVPAGTASALAFYPLAPCRVADTRGATGPLGGPFLSGGAAGRAFPVQSSACNIPSTAKAYSLNVTAVPHKTLNYLTTWPTGQTQPNVSTLNSSTGAVTANAAIVPAGSSGEISVFVYDDADVILDVDGYFAPPATGGLSLYTVTPCRVIDTRPTAFSGTKTVNVEGSTCAPPATAQGYVLNATVVPPGALNYLTLWPAGATQPNVSTLNADDGAITSNMAIVPTTNGSIDAFAYNPTNLILDISSYFAPTSTVTALIANAGGPYNGTAGQAVTFDGSKSTAPSGQTLTYAWNFGDSTTGTGVSPTHSYSAAGTYTVSLKVTDTSGGSNTAMTTASIAQALPPPTISGFTPSSGAIGTLITVTGTNFKGTNTPTPQIILSQQGGGSLNAPVDTFTPTSLSFVIPAGAATGQIGVTVGAQSGKSSGTLTVTTSSNFTLQVTPGTGKLIQGQSTTFVATISSSTGFDGLASLSVQGLPSGVTASFKPTSIAVGQNSVLTISAPAGQAVATSTLKVTGSATIQGQSVTQTASASLQVAAVSTTFLGRTVVDDVQQEPIAGVTIKFLGVTDKGNATGCSGQTTSDGGGNFSLTNLSSACIGPQLISYDGSTATSPAGKYAGVNLSYTLISGQVVSSPVLIHLPRIDNAEIKQVQQNSSVDQTFTFQSIPGLQVTVYAGTTFSLDDGTKPNPFPLVGIDIPVDRLPDQMATNGMLTTFIVAFQPANAMASQPVAITYPNPLNYPSGSAATLATLDPTHGYMVPYGTGTVSKDGTRFIPDADPVHPGHRFGLVHFDWHGPMPPPPPPTGPGPCGSACCAGGGGGDGGGGGGGGGPEAGDPVDLSSGLQVVRATDIVVNGERGSITINRVFRSMDNNMGPFGIGTNHNYGYVLGTDNFIKGTCQCLTLVMPDGNQFVYTETGTNTFTNSTVPSLIGSQITIPSSGTYNLRWKNGIVYQFSTSSQGALLAFLNTITDRNGNAITLVRGNSAQPSQITQIVDPVGRALTLTYDANNRITQITDPIGRTVQYTYNSQGTLATVTNAAGGVTTYAYDTSNNLLKITDARGVVAMQDTYDSNGRVIQQVQADGGVLNFAYTLLNSMVPTSPVLLTVVTDALGNQTSYRFDPSQNLLNVTDATGQVRVFGHSMQQNNAVSSISGAGHCPVCGDPTAGDLTYTFDSQGNILTRTDSLGNTTKYTYDPVFSQVTSITDPLGHTTKYTYDASGNKLSQTDPNGNTTSYTYSTFGQIVQTTDPLGRTSTTSYDSFGNTSGWVDPAGNKTQITHDAVSRLTQMADGLGNTNTVTYDPLDRRLTHTDPKGGLVKFTYDAVGNMLSLIDESGNKTSFTYDGLNRPLTSTDPRGKVQTGTYDFNGNLVKYVDRDGQTDTFTYDALNRVTAENYQDGSTVKRSYDARGRLVEAVDSVGGTFDFAYDADGRATSASTQFGTTYYTYDAAGRITASQVSGQQATKYTYDAAGNFLTASQTAASATLAYDARNNQTSTARLNGVSSQYTYDAAAHLLSITHSGGQGINIPLTYAYDPAINRTTYGASSTQPAAVANNFDPYNRLTASGGTSYAYDDNGALISSTDSTGTTTYAWDSRHRLTSISAPNGQKTTFTYDFSTNLIQQTDAGPILNLTQNFVLDDLTNVAYIGRSNGDNVLALTGRRIDQNLAVTHSSGLVEYALADASNSTVATVDQNGKLVSSFTYEPFGKTTTTSTYPFQYTGRVPVTAGLYYYRTRYYACNGRFISEDPLGFGGGSTLLYEYAANNPLNRNDPTGQELTCQQRCTAWGAVYVVSCNIAFIAAAALATGATAGIGGFFAGAGAKIAAQLICNAGGAALVLNCQQNCNQPPQPACPRGP